MSRTGPTASIENRFFRPSWQANMSFPDPGKLHFPFNQLSALRHLPRQAQHALAITVQGDLAQTFEGNFHPGLDLGPKLGIRKKMIMTPAHRVHRSSSFTAERAWDALDIAELNGITVRLHWTDQPYKWHTNQGQEVFAVMDGRVDMHVRGPKGVDVIELAAGDVFYAGAGCEHVAHPQGAARILVVETKGSV